MTSICKNCSEDFSIDPHRPGKKSQFCSQSCRVVWFNRGAIRRNRTLKSKHGITIDIYLKMYESQKGCCAACGEPGYEWLIQDNMRKTLQVDHDHACCPGRRSCGKCIRALLCAGCNIALGNLGDSSTKARKLAEYIDSH